MEVNLVQEKRQGLGKPNLIYVGKINHSDSENLRFLNRKNYDSGIGESTTLESENLRGIKTNIINTDSINPKSDEVLLLIKDKCKLNEFTKEEKTILEDVIDNLYYIDNLKVGNITVNHFKILDKLNLITKDNLVQLLDILKNTSNIQNAKNYLMICLYNNLGNININKIIDKFKTNIKKFMKWLCNKFSYPCEDDLIQDFSKETYSNIDFEKELDINQFEQDYENEIDFDIY